MQTVQSAAGIFGLLALAFAISENHRAVSLRQVAIGLALTFVLAALFLKIPQLKVAFAVIGDAVDAIARRDAGRHLVRVRLSRRRPAAVRAQDAGQPNSSWRCRHCRWCWS